MLGMIYAMVAVGFTLFFGVLDVIKFSHGDVLVVGAFTGLAPTPGSAALGVDSPAVQLLVMTVVATLSMALLGALIAKYLVLPLARAAAQHAADHADAGHGAARGGAPVLSAGLQSEAFPRLLPRIDAELRRVHAARRQHDPAARRRAARSSRCIS